MEGAAARRGGSWARVIAVAVALGLSGAAVAGCTGDPGPGTEPVSTSSVATDPPATQPDLLTSTEPLSIAEAGSQRHVEAATDLLRAQQALHRAVMEPVNPELPDFVARFTGDALTRETARIVSNREQHLAFDAPTVFRLRVESMTDNDDGSITAVACYTLKARLFRSDSGETLDDTVFSQRHRYRIASTASAWQLSDEEALDDGVLNAESCKAS